MIAWRTIEAYRAPSGDGCAIGLAGFLRQWPFFEPSVVFDADVYAQHEVTELYVERVGIVGYLGQAQAALARFEFAYVGLGLAEFLGNGVLGHVCFATHGFEFNADGAIEIRIHRAGLYCPQGYIPKWDMESYRARMSPLGRVPAMMVPDGALQRVRWMMIPDGTLWRNPAMMAPDGRLWCVLEVDGSGWSLVVCFGGWRFRMEPRSVFQWLMAPDGT